MRSATSAANACVSSVARLGLADAAGAQVEDRVRVELADRRAVRALHVVGEDLELRLGVDQGVARQQQVLVRLLRVGLLRVRPDDDLAVEDRRARPRRGCPCRARGSLQCGFAWSIVVWLSTCCVPVPAKRPFSVHSAPSPSRSDVEVVARERRAERDVVRREVAAAALPRGQRVRRGRRPCSRAGACSARARRRRRARSRSRRCGSSGPGAGDSVSTTVACERSPATIEDARDGTPRASPSRPATRSRRGSIGSRDDRAGGDLAGRRPSSRKAVLSAVNGRPSSVASLREVRLATSPLRDAPRAAAAGRPPAGPPARATARRRRRPRPSRVIGLDRRCSATPRRAASGSPSSAKRATGGRAQLDSASRAPRRKRGRRAVRTRRSRPRKRRRRLPCSARRRLAARSPAGHPAGPPAAPSRARRSPSPRARARAPCRRSARCARRRARARSPGTM